MESNLNFSAALVRLKQGDHLARKDWGVESYIYLDQGEVIMVTTLSTEKEKGEVWEILQSDILADDWAIVKEAE